MITVFTPTYNRGHLLIKLFDSLKKQTCKKFEWIVADDGSKDNTEEIVNEFILTNPEFRIIYFKQENSGKHIAINKGVEFANGDLFFIVDSDDFLSEDAIQIIYDNWNSIENKIEFDGIVFNKANLSNQAIGNPKYKIIDATPLEFRYKFKEKGDKAEVIKTELFKKHPFPVNGEKFCPEAMFFNKLEKLRYINKNIYYCEYLPGGLSDNSYKIRKNSPVNSCTFYYELSQQPILNSLQRLKAAINFYRFKRFTAAPFPIPYKDNFMNLVSKKLADIMFKLKDSKK